RPEVPTVIGCSASSSMPSMLARMRPAAPPPAARVTRRRRPHPTPAGRVTRRRRRTHPPAGRVTRRRRRACIETRSIPSRDAALAGFDTAAHDGGMSPLHVLVLPGGGYRRHAPHEGEPVAAWLRGLGHDASVFAYPVATPHPTPLDAVRAEVRRVRAAGATRVALLGFSAGGHAAGMAAYAPASADERVDAVVLGYPVVSMMLPTHRGSREKLLGAQASWDARRATSLD